MSYESKLLEQYSMPTRRQVAEALLRALLNHGGVISEFASGQTVVNRLADEFELNNKQRSAVLKTVYRKEQRVKKSLLWHRLLFRAADSLASEKLISRPTQTFHLTKKREWMLTEKGFDEALKLLRIPRSRKSFLPIRTHEVQKVIKQISEASLSEDYNPFDRSRIQPASATLISLKTSRGVL